MGLTRPDCVALTLPEDTMGTNNNTKLQFVDDQWSLVNDHFDRQLNRTWETLFSLGNGYIGMRGSFEEGLDSFSTDGTYINGFYDTFPLHYPEKFYGYAETDQLILNVANARVVRLRFHDGEPYNPLTGTIVDYHRKLDLRAGKLVRGHAGHRQELGGLPVADGDRAGLVEQQRVHVAGRLDGPARHGQHIALDQAVHAGDADGRQQRADRGRD